MSYSRKEVSCLLVLCVWTWSYPVCCPSPLHFCPWGAIAKLRVVLLALPRPSCSEGQHTPADQSSWLTVAPALPSGLVAFRSILVNLASFFLQKRLSIYPRPSEVPTLTSWKTVCFSAVTFSPGTLLPVPYPPPPSVSVSNEPFPSVHQCAVTPPVSEAQQQPCPASGRPSPHCGLLSSCPRSLRDSVFSDFATAPPLRQESGPWRSHVAPSLLPFVFICYADLFQLWVPDPVPHHPRVTPVLQRPVLDTCSPLLSLAPLPVSSTCKKLQALP